MASERVIPLRPLARDDAAASTPEREPRPSLVLPGGSRWPWFDPTAEARAEAGLRRRALADDAA